jgi:hypothetical protein
MNHVQVESGSLTQVYGLVHMLMGTVLVWITENLTDPTLRRFVVVNFRGDMREPR